MKMFIATLLMFATGVITVIDGKKMTAFEGMVIFLLAMIYLTIDKQPKK